MARNDFIRIQPADQFGFDPKSMPSNKNGTYYFRMLYLSDLQHAFSKISLEVFCTVLEKHRGQNRFLVFFDFDIDVIPHLTGSALQHGEPLRYPHRCSRESNRLPTLQQG